MLKSADLIMDSVLLQLQLAGVAVVIPPEEVLVDSARFDDILPGNDELSDSN